MSVLSQACFHDEKAAFEKVESVVWIDGVVCPRCGVVDNWYDLSKTRVGLKKCAACRKQFTVRIGTIFEQSKLPMTKWLQAIHLLACSKKGISSHQLARVLEITVKSAWFLSHRIREAMRTGDLEQFGTGGSIVEVDETFIGNDRTKKPKGQKKGRGHHHKHKVLSLVDRETGRARSMVVDDLKIATLTPILRANIAREARVMTDEAGQYVHLKRDFAEHGVVHHGKHEYVSKDDPSVHTNTIEGYFSIFKRGMKGVYQHASKHHLHRYVAEFDFRYSYRVAAGVDDRERADRMLAGVIGRRLTYRDSSSPA